MNDRSVVEIPIAGGALRGELVVPLDARGIAVLAVRDEHEQRAPFVETLAEVLTTAAFPVATLRVALDGSAGADEPALLGSRLESVVDWILASDQVRRLPIGLLAAGTSVAAVLEAAARRKGIVHAVVAWNGRPDLAREVLDRVLAPTLFLVTETHASTLEIDGTQMTAMRAPHALVTVPDELEGPTHAEVERHVTEWLGMHLPELAARH